MNKVWRRYNGKEILINDMSDDHIRNSIRKIKRENPINYKDIEEYIWLKEELDNRKQEKVSKFNNEVLDEEYKRMYKVLNLINRDTIYGDMEYEIQRSKIDGFVKACEIFLSN